MAAGPISGISGNFTITGHNFRVAAWSGSINHEMNDVTGFAQAPWREQIGGLKSLTGVASGFLESNGTNTTPGLTNLASVGSAFTATAMTGCTFSGNATVSAINIGTAVNGVASCSIVFASTGEVTETWDEAA
jgi:hypothetical protein